MSKGSGEQKNAPEKISRSSKLDSSRQGWKLIKEYMKSRDIPDWFRGTSTFQTEAANNLFESLLFDLEQHSSHRVRACLSSLGLKPMITTDHLKVLMRLSRGSDLAFLWFLWELHYKSDGPNYTVNEQILLSAIAHLDMVTTLRELDRILPKNPPPEPKKPPPKEPRVIVTTDNIKKLNIPEKSLSPYYQTLRTPKVYKNNTTLKRPDLKISMAEYEMWEDPNYIVRNESNRWFADYKPRVAKRLVHNILKEEINRIFDDPGYAAENAETSYILCQYHQRLEQAEKNLNTELQLIAREQCQRYFDVDAAKQERTRQRIMEQLQRNVDMFMSKFRKYAEKVPLGKANEKNKLIEVLVGEDTIQYCHPGSEESCQGQGQGHNEADYESIESEDSSDESCQENNINKTSSHECQVFADCKCLMQKTRDSLLKNGGSFGKNGKNGNNGSARSSANKALTMKGNNQCDDQDMTAVSPSPSKRFFVAAQEHKPYLFEYHKIFNIKHPLIPKKINVKQLCAEALDSDMSLTSKYQGKEKPNIDKALNKGFKKDWSKAVRDYNLEHETPICPELMKQEQIKIDGEEVPLKFDRNYFDPNDKNYMIYMLKRGFDFMKRKPKFVLATLPDAHKLPSFFYFIQNRFGKRYTFEERQKLYRESLKILRALEKLTKTVPMPKISLFCTSPFVSYSCRDYLIEKGAKIRQKYYDELDNIIMEQARIFWFAMRPYLCSSGPPRNTYFAYMPSRSIDITRFRQWKSSEFMDAKKEWDRRQREKRNKCLH